MTTRGVVGGALLLALAGMLLELLFAGIANGIAPGHSPAALENSGYQLLLWRERTIFSVVLFLLGLGIGWAWQQKCGTSPRSKSRFDDDPAGSAEETVPPEPPHRLLLTHSHDMIGIIDQNGTLRYVSAANSRITGFADEDYVGKNCFEFLHPEDVPAVRRAFQQVLQVPGATGQVRYRHLRKDGEYIWMETVGANYLADDRIGGVILNARPIQEIIETEEFKKKNQEILEKQVREKTAHMQQVLQKQEELLRRTALQKRLVSECNRGATYDELLRHGLSCLKENTGVDSGGVYLFDDAVQVFRLVAHTGLSPEFVQNVQGIDRASVWYAGLLTGLPQFVISASPHSEGREALTREGIVSGGALPISENGKIIGSFHVASHSQREFPQWVIDVLEDSIPALGSVLGRLRLLDSLRQSEERFKQLVENAFEGIAVQTIDRYLFVNPALERLTGYSRAELLAGGPLDLVVPEDRAALIERNKRRQQKEELPQQFPFRIRRKDGVVRHMELSAGLVTWDGVPATQVVVIDVSERHQVWEEEQQQLSALEVEVKKRTADLLEANRRLSGEIAQRQRAETELADHARMLESLFRAIPHPIFYKTAGQTYLGCNQAFADLAGVPGPEIKGRKVHEVWGNRMASLGHDQDRQVVDLKREMNFEVTLRDASGEQREFLVSRAPFAHADGRVAGIVGVMFDQTEEKQTRMSHRHQAAIVECSDDAILGLAPSGVITSWNRGAERMLGFPAVAVIGKPLPVLMPKSLVKEELACLERALAGQNVQNHETRLTHRQGQEILISFTYSPIRDDQGAILGVSCIGRDISMRKATEEAIRRANDEIRQLFDAAVTGICVVNIEGRLMRLNETFCRMFGLSRPAPFINALCSEVLDADFFAAWEHLAERVRQGKTQETLEMLKKGQDGRSVTLLIQATPYGTQDSGWRGMVLSFSDITELRRAEKALLETQRHLGVMAERERAMQETMSLLQRNQEIKDVRSRLVATVSHEFRTPLTIILSSVEMLENYGGKFSPGDQKKHFQRIYDSIHDLTSMLEDMLLLNRTEQKREEFRPAETSMKSFCEGVLDEVANLHRGTHRILSEGIPETADVRAVFDVRLVKVALLNLLSNALKYSEAGTDVIFRVSVTADDLMFEVQDFGKGIREEDRHHLFEPFFRGKNTGEVRGTGLGLLIVKRLAELMGGSIRFTTEENRGSCFTLKLPRFAAIPENNDGQPG